MSYYLCLACGEIYNSKVFAPIDMGNHFFRCPRASCMGEIVQVDELMLPIVKKLIDLGYNTDYCCSGHSYDDYIHSYIKFEHLSNKTIKILFKNLPKSWEAEPCGNTYAIYPSNRYFGNEKNMIEKQKKIFNLLSDLMDWVEKLPKSPEEESIL